ncbi:MAG: ATP-binding protein [Methylacidiphilales bacterium]|nr:ATP-binding protein [Candidatus Methylacidiphilales bacterium]
MGANASGKSNILKIFKYIKFLLADSWILSKEIQNQQVQPNQTVPFPLIIKPFVLSTDPVILNKPSAIEIAFELNSTLFTYAISIKNEIIQEETLTSTKANKTVIYFKRKLSASQDILKVEIDNLVNKHDQWDFHRKLNNKNSFMHTYYDVLLDYSIKSNKKTQEVIDTFKNKLDYELFFNFWSRSIINIPQVEINKSLTTSNWELFAFRFYDNPQNILYKQKARDYISRLDTSVNNFFTEKYSNPVFGDQFRIDFTINKDGTDFRLNYADMSSGTKSLLLLLGAWFFALDNNLPIILDNFDSDLHPDIISELIDHFCSYDNPPSNSQLIIAGHAYTLLNQLDKYLHYFTNKNNEQETILFRLSDYKTVEHQVSPRTDDNYYKKYRSGNYGAKPYIT